MLAQQGGAQSPGGDELVFLNIMIPALTPGAREYMPQLARSPFLKLLANAILRGSVEITNQPTGARERRIAHALGNALQLLRPTFELYLDEIDSKERPDYLDEPRQEEVKLIAGAYRQLEQLRAELVQFCEQLTPAEIPAAPPTRPQLALVDNGEGSAL